MRVVQWKGKQRERREEKAGIKIYEKKKNLQMCLNPRLYIVKTQ